MGKMEFEFEIVGLQGLKVRIKAENDELPKLKNALKSHLNDLISLPSVISPTPRVLQPSLFQDEDEGVPNATAPVAESKPKRRSVTPNGSSRGKGNSKEQPIVWKHDISSWGNPKEKWATTQKAIWLLYVVGHTAQISEMTSARIASTFNQHFREFKTIISGNVTRDLRKAKKDGLVQADTTKDPSPWYLTDSGKSYAVKLVEETRGITKHREGE